VTPKTKYKCNYSCIAFSFVLQSFVSYESSSSSVILFVSVHFGCFRYPWVDFPFRPPCHMRRHHCHYPYWGYSISIIFRRHHRPHHLGFQLAAAVHRAERPRVVLAHSNRHEEEVADAHTNGEVAEHPAALQGVRWVAACNSHRVDSQAVEVPFVDEALVSRRWRSPQRLDYIDPLLLHRVVVLVAVVESALFPCSASFGLAERLHQSASVLIEEKARINI
jgi:hypothetical protein